LVNKGVIFESVADAIRVHYGEVKGFDTKCSLLFFVVSWGYLLLALVLFYFLGIIGKIFLVLFVPFFDFYGSCVYRTGCSDIQYTWRYAFVYFNLDVIDCALNVSDTNHDASDYLYGRGIGLGDLRFT